MKTVGDLKSFVDHFKNDINERNELQAPMIRKGLVFYIHTDIVSHDINERNELQAPMIRKGLVFYIHTDIASQRLENTRSIYHCINS